MACLITISETVLISQICYPNMYRTEVKKKENPISLGIITKVFLLCTGYAETIDRAGKHSGTS